jgi:hypothetical protein
MFSLQKTSRIETSAIDAAGFLRRSGSRMFSLQKTSRIETSAIDAAGFLRRSGSI